jgi:hypothetical protein
VNAAIVAYPKWQDRLIRSGYFVGALLFHLVIFFMVATWIVFKAPSTPVDNTSFQPVTVAPPPPPAPPAPSGGQAVNDLEPSVEMAPSACAPSIVVTSSPSNFSIKAVKVTIPNLPAAATPPAGTGLAGHDTPGQDSGSGSPFGTSQNTGTPELVGYLYDLKQTRDRKPTNMDPGGYHNKIKEFIASNWNSEILEPYYKSTQALSTSSIFIPVINASDGPKAFGVEADVQPNMYCVWYKVSASPPQDGTYHFVGVGDDILAVRVDGRTVLDGTLYGVTNELRHKQKSINMTNFDPTCGPDGDFWIGTPFHASASDPVDIDVLIGEEPGGKSAYFLYIQRDESTYQSQSNGSPLLPVFQLDSKLIQPVSAPRSFPPFATTPEPWQAVGK